MKTPMQIPDICFMDGELYVRREDINLRDRRLVPDQAYRPYEPGRRHRISIGARLVAIAVLVATLSIGALPQLKIADLKIADFKARNPMPAQSLYLLDGAVIQEETESLAAFPDFVPPSFETAHKISRFDIVHAFETGKPSHGFDIWYDSSGFAFGDYAFHKKYLFPAFLRFLETDREKNGSPYYDQLTGIIPLMAGIKWDQTTRNAYGREILARAEDREAFSAFRASAIMLFDGNAGFKKLEQRFMLDQYEWRLDQMRAKYGFDINKVGEFAAGMIMASINNAPVRSMAIMEEMARRALPAQGGVSSDAMLEFVRATSYLSKISEAEFASLLQNAVAAVLTGEMEKGKITPERRRELTNNYARVNRAYITPYVDKTYMDDEARLAETKAAALDWLCAAAESSISDKTAANAVLRPIKMKLDTLITINNFSDESISENLKGQLVAQYGQAVHFIARLAPPGKNLPAIAMDPKKAPSMEKIFIAAPPPRPTVNRGLLARAEKYHATKAGNSIHPDTEPLQPNRDFFAHAIKYYEREKSDPALTDSRKSLPSKIRILVEALARGEYA